MQRFYLGLLRFFAKKRLLLVTFFVNFRHKLHCDKMLVVVKHNVLTDGGKAVGFQILYQRVGRCDVRLETEVVACAVGAIVRYLRNYCRLDVALGNDASTC